MNTSKSLISCFLATAFAFAQVPPEEQPIVAPLDSIVPSIAPSSSSSSSQITISLPPPPASSSSSVAEETKQPTPAPEGKTIFDSLRGRAYNPYSTAGAAPTIEDLIIHPSDINGQKFFYVSPTNYVGYVAFGSEIGSVLLGLDRSPYLYYSSLPALILGYANSVFGIALNYSVAKEWWSNNDDDIDLRMTSPNDNIGLYISTSIGSVTLYANANWITYDSSYALTFDGNKTKTDYSTISANLGLTGNSGSLAYDIYFNGIRDGGILTINGDRLIDATGPYMDPPYWGLALNFDLGNAILQNSTARVIIGANSSLYMLLYDKTDSENGFTKMGIRIIPTILAEVSLVENWLAFTGAGHSLSLKAGDEDRNNSTSRLTARSEWSGAFAGIRYQKTNWAVEAQISTNMFNNPFGGFNDHDMFAEFGGFIYF